MIARKVAQAPGSRDRREMTTTRTIRFVRAAACGAALASVFVLPSAAPAAARTCYADGYGARHDGRTDDTIALQHAIDDCGPGDQIVLTGGVYLSGPLTLSSGDTFVVSRGATLQGTSNHDAYPGDGDTRIRALISADGASNITLTGSGTIDGNGAFWWSDYKRERAAHAKPTPRPRLIYLRDVSDVRVTGLSLLNSPSYGLVLERARNVTVEGLTIRITAADVRDALSTDGIDVSGQNMQFRNLTIDVGDDHIAFKSGYSKPHLEFATNNITVRDCKFLRGHGLSIGSQVTGGVTGITVENIVFEGSRYGIRIKTDRDHGGTISNIVYRNVTMRNVQDPIMITDYYPSTLDNTYADDTARPLGPHTPMIRNIALRHIDITGAKYAGRFFGLPESPLRGIELSDVSIEAEKGMVVRHAAVKIDGTISVRRGTTFVFQAGGSVASNLK
jgi:polygalacturonase